MIHVRGWQGAASVRITDMTNAGKRGKRCQTVTFQGWLTNSHPDDEVRRAHTLALEVGDWASNLDPSTSFDEAAAQMRAMVEKYGPLPEYAAKIYTDDIRGVDAPREKIEAGVEGKWYARADESGVFVSDNTDPYNDPAIMTDSRQSNARAYELARKVWASVESCKTFSEVWDVLRAAGCQMHYWCRVD